jgi:hypothetical protein
VFLPALRARLRRGVVLAACLGTCLTWIATTAPTASAARPTLAPDESLSVASQAAGWLSATVLGPDGAARIHPGPPDAESTAWSALALRAAGLEQEADAPTGWLERNVDDLAREDGRDSPAGLALLILVARADNRPAESFGGQDLVARLLATRGSDGQFGPSTALPRTDPLGGIPARQGLVLSALGADGRTDAGAAEWLEQRACPDGGWQFDRTDPTASCDADPVTTGYAIQGLAAVGRDISPRAVDSLARLQDPDGGFPLLPGLTDPLATAVGLQGLLAAGEDPNTDRWRKGTGADAATPFGALERFDTDPSGGFSPAPHTPPDAALTSRVVIAAAGQPLPLAATTPDTGQGDTGSGGSPDTQSSNTAAGPSDSFSAVPLVAVAAVVLGVVAGIYAYRRRHQAL